MDQNPDKSFLLRKLKQFINEERGSLKCMKEVYGDENLGYYDINQLAQDSSDQKHSEYPRKLLQYTSTVFDKELAPINKEANLSDHAISDAIFGAPKRPHYHLYESRTLIDEAKIKRQKLDKSVKSEKEDDENFQCFSIIPKNDSESTGCLHHNNIQNDENKNSQNPQKIEVNNKDVNDNWENLFRINKYEEAELSSSDTLKEINKSKELKNESLTFWYWDAWEDAIERPGEIFLFGKTRDNQSICVHVKNICHIIYLLPREYLLDPITEEITDKKVTLSDVYNELDTDISNSLGLRNYNSKKITKKFAFHPMEINVPQVCDYLEIHYDGEITLWNQQKKYKTVAHIFGANSSALERFLLLRKIKGPCWLNLTNFIVNKSPISWCKNEVTCLSPMNISIAMDSTLPAVPPPVSILTLFVKTAKNLKTKENEIVVISCLVNKYFNLQESNANPPCFSSQMCGFTKPRSKNWPTDLNEKLTSFKALKYIKHDSESSLLSWFLNLYERIDPDFIVTHDMNDCQLNLIANRTLALKIPQRSRLCRLRMMEIYKNNFIGRMVCDMKLIAEEFLGYHSSDLNTLCIDLLDVNDKQRMNLNEEDILDCYKCCDGIVKLISFTTKDCFYIYRIMCKLDIISLALQITNICGNLMSKTLQGGYSNQIEYLLLHAFTAENYIVPDKQKNRYNFNYNNGRKKPAYAGGLVLEPNRGFYEKYILLMDFNSLYPTIIQEYNICFTTVKKSQNNDDATELPDPSTAEGILPRQIRILVEARKENLKLISDPNVEPKLKEQYEIRQLALKNIANSMYGCLGYANARFFGQHLAACVTRKGREILSKTVSQIKQLKYEVIYGDTDSIMINTKIFDYDEVFRIIKNIKNFVNKNYKYVELDFDGIFKCLLLLNKKKYAGIRVYRTSKDDFNYLEDIKGLDIIRHDVPKLVVIIGKLVLDEILSGKPLKEKIEKILWHLESFRKKLAEGLIDLQSLVISKKLTKDPKEYVKPDNLPHVKVALRMNETMCRRYKKGDVVGYIICQKPNDNAAETDLIAYHLDEMKYDKNLKVNANYYLSKQIFPAVWRMCAVLEGIDDKNIAKSLGVNVNCTNSWIKPVEQFRACDKFFFICSACKTRNMVASAFREESVLEKCSNPECVIPPHKHITSIRNQLILTIRKFVKRFYRNWTVCCNSLCCKNSAILPHVTNRNHQPFCVYCADGSLVRQYSGLHLYNQLMYFQYMFDLSQYKDRGDNLAPETKLAYTMLKKTVDQYLDKSAYPIISLSRIFSQISHFRNNHFHEF